MKRMILPVVLLVGCSSWHGTGTVVEKDYDPSWVQTTTTQQCYTSGKSTTCIPNTSTTVWPQSWSLKIRDPTGDTHWVDVGENEYDQADVGDAFSNGEPGT